MRILIPFLLVSLVLFFYQIDVSEVFKNIYQFRYLGVVALITSLFTFSFFLSSLRFALISRHFFSHVSYKESCKAILHGQFGASIPLIGSFLAQNLSLKKTNQVPAAIGTLISLYDRLSMAGVGLLLSLLAALQYYQLDINHLLLSNQSLFKALFFFMLSVLAVFYFLFAKYDRTFLKKLHLKSNFILVAKVSVVNFFIWAVSSLAIGGAVYFLHPSGPFIYYLYAGMISSFIASIPISSGGWGIREVAAVSIFSYLLLPKETTLLVAVSVGLFSYLSVFIAWGVLGLIKDKPLAPKKPVLMPHFSLSEKTIVIIFGLMAAISIFFQFHFKVNDTTININFADIFSLAGLVIFALNFKNIPLKFTIPYLHIYIALFLMAFLISLFVGFYHFGFTSFAVVNKFFGFFVLLGYGALGALYITYSGKEGYIIMLKAMAITVSIIVLSEFGDYIITLWKNYPFMYSTFSGFSANRNAFAIQVLIVLSLLLLSQQTTRKGFLEKSLWINALLFIGVFLTFSRSSIIVLCFLLVFWMFFKMIKKTVILKSLILSFCIAGSFKVLEFVRKIYFLMVSESTLPEKRSLFYPQYSSNYSDNERWYTIYEGLKIWWDHPFFGGGLGRFVFDEVQKEGQPRVIHNTLVWLLAEFGLIGTLPFAIFIGLLLRQVIISLRSKGQNLLTQKIDQSTLSLLFIFGLMSLAHEVFYQRCFWLMLGVLLAYPKLKRPVP